MLLTAGFLAGLIAPASAQAPAPEITAARGWPSPDYTRITLETKGAVRFSMQSVKDPDRLVLDLEGIAITPALYTKLPYNPDKDLQPIVLSYLSRNLLAVNKTLADPVVRAKLIEMGLEPRGGTPEEFAQHIARELVKWSEVAKRAQIKL